ncbi:anti-sigma factor family protein [Streptomyces sp. NPDC047980]|uniref:anti-sigma factor family protein n=1 Tax=Streptomyces sp. NPDC047980 TaxID=3365494 RepID=UPI003714C874
MTSSTGTAQHPDVSEIADLAEGLLPPTRQAAVRRHLEGCELCADVRASLEEIRGLLGTLPGPQRMPADIAGRIDAALAAEALLNATAPDGEPTDVSRETALTPQKPETLVSDRPAGHARAATGPGRRPSGRRRRRVAALTAAFSAAAVGLSALLLQSLGGTSSDTSEKKADTAASAASGGRDFTAATLQTRVNSLLSSDGTPKDAERWTATSPRVEKDASVGAEATPLRSPAVTVPPCVQKGTGRTDTAIAVDQGVFEGTPAFLVVLPHPEDTSRVQAYVVAATCVETAPAGKGELLVTHAYPRP